MTYELYRRRIEIDNYKKTQLFKTVQKMTRIRKPCESHRCLDRMCRGLHD